MIDAHLPALLVVLPLMAAPIVVILRHRTAVWALSTAVCWGGLGLAWRLLQQVLEEGTVSYHLGGWPPPWGIEYRVDAANAYVLLLLATIAAVVLPYARQSVAKEVPDPLGTEMGVIADEAAYGRDVGEALKAMAERLDMQDLRFLAVAVTIQQQSGGKLAEVLYRLSKDIR